MWYNLRMYYNWDPAKEKTNIRKHGVSFSEAKEALNCGLVIVLKESSEFGEDRYVYLGICKKINILVVVVAYPDEVCTRIISARKANKRERKIYEAQL